MINSCDRLIKLINYSKPAAAQVSLSIRSARVFAEYNPRFGNSSAATA